MKQWWNGDYHVKTEIKEKFAVPFFPTRTSHKVTWK
jgi:hypothetical protein